MNSASLSRNRVLVTILCASVLAMVESALASQQAANAGASKKPPTVLFMCPHGAARSVLASAYFRRLATERGLNVRVTTAGTDPNPDVSPNVARHLTSNGYDLPITKPRRVTADDMAAADVIISIGCDLKDLPPTKGTILRWDDVPDTGEDLAGADEKIRERVVELLDELVRRQRR